MTRPPLPPVPARAPRPVPPPAAPDAGRAHCPCRDDASTPSSRADSAAIPVPRPAPSPAVPSPPGSVAFRPSGASVRATAPLRIASPSLGRPRHAALPVPPPARFALPAAAPASEGPAVLVTGSGGPAGIATIRRLLALGHRVVAADADRRAAGAGLAQAAVTLPRADHPRFLDALLGIAIVHEVDALIGTVAEELPAIAAGVDRLNAAGVATWLPDLDAVELCCDKAAFARCMRRHGVPHPATASGAERVAELPGPWIVKPRWGRGSRGVVPLDRLADVAAAVAADPTLIAQTRVTGREFTADALVDRNGRLLTVVPRWRDETRAGISVKGTTFDSVAVTDVAAAALDAVGLTGPANVQGFVAEDGAVVAVEINPRFSGGLPLTLAAGADVVGTYLAGIRDPHAGLPLLYFTPGVRMSRYFAEVYTGADGARIADPCAATESVR